MMMVVMVVTMMVMMVVCAMMSFTMMMVMLPTLTLTGRSRRGGVIGHRRQIYRLHIL